MNHAAFRRILASAAIACIAIFVSAAAIAEPLHTYLTYSGAPETSIDINILTEERVEGVELYYDTVSRGGELDAYKHRATPAYVQTYMELSDERALYVAALDGLEPDTVYYFVAGETEEYGLSKERSFRTLPGGDKPFRFVNGGDMGVDGLAIPLLTLAGKQDPDFAVIGGDIAYVNGELGRPDTWNQWLRNWDELMVTSDGRMIPIVTAIGNHETNNFDTQTTEMNAPWYYGLFGRQGENIYYTRTFGDLLTFFLLDSGHLNTHESQAGWLDAELGKHADSQYSFAAYHVPLYPAHRAYEGMGSQLGRQHWGPLFDKHGLTVALEHHDHVFKRSKPLKGNEVVENGTVYVGDGCFGRGPRTIDPELRWYNEIEKSAAHFWLVDVSKDGLKFEAIDDSGATIDEFELK